MEVETRCWLRQRRERTQPPQQPQWATIGQKTAFHDVRCRLLHLASPLERHAHHRIVVMCCMYFPQGCVVHHLCCKIRWPRWAKLLMAFPDGSSGRTCCPVHLGAVARGRTTSRLRSGFATRIIQMLSPLGSCFLEWHCLQHGWNQQVASGVWWRLPHHRPGWPR